MSLTGREIALAFWFVVVAIWAFRNPDIRAALWNVVKAVADPKILLPGFLLLVYVGGVVWLLWRVGVWTTTLTLDTAVWFALVGLPMPFRFITIRGVDSPLRRVLGESFTALVVVEFIIGTYTFHWAVELVLVPVVTMVVVLHEVALHYREGETVTKVFGWARVTVVLLVFGSAGVMAVNDLGTLHSWSTLRQVLLAPVMSLLLVPFILAFGAYAAHEEAKIREQVEV